MCMYVARDDFVHVFTKDETPGGGEAQWSVAAACPAKNFTSGSTSDDSY